MVGGMSSSETVRPRVPCPAEPSVGVIVNYRNPEAGLIERCVESLEYQEFRNWRAYLCDDASERPVAVAGNPRVVQRRNGVRLGMVANTVVTVAQATEDIMVQLDGDDCLLPEALNYIVNAHINGADMTWGSCKSVETYTRDGAGFSAEYRIANIARSFSDDLNEFSAPQPRSYRRALFVEAWAKWGWTAFTHRSGKQWPVSGDIAVFYPLLRVAKHPRPITEILYLVSRTGPSHDKHPRKVRAAIIAQAEALS